MGFQSNETKNSLSIYVFVFLHFNVILIRIILFKYLDTKPFANDFTKWLDKIWFCSTKILMVESSQMLGLKYEKTTGLKWLKLSELN